MNNQDTIAAIATAPGRGGIGILRVSGSQAVQIAQQICRKPLAPRQIQLCRLYDVDDAPIDTGIVLYFAAPQSFTGEDVVEFQIHGGPVLLDLLLNTVCALGARQAGPGEFSQRAYLNGKLDLAQAEAIADMINSTTAQAARSATRSLQGEFSKEINALVEAITQLRVYIEAAIDFPEEEIDFIAEAGVLEQLNSIADHFAQVERSAKQGALLQQGMKLVISGKPNAGKSSLLNALAGHDRAIVTDIPGTTRDTLSEHIHIDGMPLHVVDTAGVRASGDAIEREGMRRAQEEIASADRILLVVDATDHVSSEQSRNRSELLSWQGGSAEIPVTVIYNKCDLSGDPPGLPGDALLETQLTGNTPEDILGVGVNNAHSLYVSAKTGAGLDALRAHLKVCAGYQSEQDTVFSARRRHLLALVRARHFLEAGRNQLTESGAGELLAEDLRQCQNALGEITGAFTNDELLEEIFSSFCIGK